MINKYWIALDDGHGINTSGKQTPELDNGLSMKENEFNSNVVKRIYNMLEKYDDIDIFLTNSEKVDIALDERISRVNVAYENYIKQFPTAKCVLVSIHANAFNGIWGTQNGTSTHYYPNNMIDKAFAEVINRNLILKTELKNRGNIGSDFQILREPKMSACLCECAFMDNLNEAKLLMSNDFRQACAEGVVNGILEYFKIDKTPSKFRNYSIIEALDVLVENEIINTKSYWQENYRKIEYLDDLIIKFAQYIKPCNKLEKEPEIAVKPELPTTPLSRIEYYETASKTRIIKGNLNNFKIACYKQGIANNKLPIKHGINLTFFTYGKNPDKTLNYWATSILYANGSVQGSWKANHEPYKQSVLIKYKDGTIEMKQILNVTELDLNKVDWAIGGIGLKNDNKLIRFEDEGFDMSVAYKTWKTLIGYSKKENNIWLITRPNILNRKTLKDKSYDLNDLALDYPEIDQLLIVDGGGSTSMYKDCKIIAGGSGRLIHSYGYFE